MKIKWSTQAELSYLENLNYWDNRNKFHTYSDKIDEELCKLEQEISVSPYFLAQYIEHLEWKICYILSSIRRRKSYQNYLLQK
jgi:hypothetical protein